jgi:hypothetical protein
VDWLAPTFGLVGVLIGGVLTAYLASRADRVKARTTALAYAVLLRDELTIATSRIESALSRGRWGAVLDPGLPYAAGLWAVEHREGVREGSIWPESRAMLAPRLKLADWEILARPFLLIATISDRSWSDDPNRPLSQDDRANFERLLQAIGDANGVLSALIARR